VEQSELDLWLPAARAPGPAGALTRNLPGLEAALSEFREFGTATRRQAIPATSFKGEEFEVPAFINEFWTARQRQASSLHEVSYRACFKPQLPRFFIERLSRPGDVVYDPFMGRGTTCLEAALLGRVPVGCDINPLSVRLVQPRLNPPELPDIAARLRDIDFTRHDEWPEELLVFFHPSTLEALCALREYLVGRDRAGTLDGVDAWIWMVALNRLTGHSNGFFSVYTLPPNQAVSVVSQQRINAKRNQVPPARDVPALILRKSRQLLGDVGAAERQTLATVAGRARLLTSAAETTPDIPGSSVALVVTSPPFLDVVQYEVDNWLRCWFIGVDASSVRLTTPNRLENWQAAMTAVFRELARVLRPGGHVAFEVGEVRNGTIRLEESVLPCGVASGLTAGLVVINDQDFTKTANCWGVDNNARGTNTNRIVVFRKP
jgi:SAM-dependent methyltransferase